MEGDDDDAAEHDAISSAPGGGDHFHESVHRIRVGRLNQYLDRSGRLVFMHLHRQDRNPLARGCACGAVR